MAASAAFAALNICSSSADRAASSVRSICVVGGATAAAGAGASAGADLRRKHACVSLYVTEETFETGLQSNRPKKLDKGGICHLGQLNMRTHGCQADSVVHNTIEEINYLPLGTLGSIVRPLDGRHRLSGALC